MVTIHEAVQLCLSANRLDLVFPLLKSHLKDSKSELYNTMILLEGTFSNVTQSYNLNQIAYQEYLREISRLNHSIQNILNDAQKTAELSVMVAKPMVSSTEAPIPVASTGKYWWMGGGLGLLLAVALGLYPLIRGNNPSSTEPVKNISVPSKMVDSNKTVTPDSTDRALTKTTSQPLGKNAAQKPVSNGSKIKKNQEVVKKEPSEVIKPKENAPVVPPSVPEVKKELPLVQLTLTVNSDLSEEKITVDGQPAKVVSDALSVKKILVTPNSNHTIVVGTCPKTIYVETIAKTLDFTCH